jgi:hypothetical protein
VDVISLQQKTATIEFSRHELLAINNALNEVCNALDVREFDTRMGCSREFAKSLLKGIGEAYGRKPDAE